MMKDLLKKWIVCLFYLFFLSQPTMGFSAGLDDMYSSLLSQGDFLYTLEATSFDMEEGGVHGGASYGYFNARPDYVSALNALRFSPLENWDINLEYEQYLPSKYGRSIDSQLGVLSDTYEYDLTYFQDYALNVRSRMGDQWEIFADFDGKRSKSQWSYASSTFPYFRADIRSNYENIHLGGRYLSLEEGSSVGQGLSHVFRPLLASDQLALTGSFGYESGQLVRKDEFTFSGNLYRANYYQRLHPHYSPEMVCAYGVRDNIEIESGLTYTTPYKFKYEYKLFRPAGTTEFTTGTYTIKDSYEIPLSLSYRPKPNWQVGLASDFTYKSQRLDYWYKATNDTITTYDSKKLRYYNVQPTLRVSYLHGEKSESATEEVSILKKGLLGKGQILINFEYQRDITELTKGSANGGQNLIDPLDILIYPTDGFVAGTEYSVFNYGDASGSAANVIPQNYHLLSTSMTYGLSDLLNFGMSFGYNSGCNLQQFVLKDRRSLIYEFEPHYFVDVKADWEVFKDSLVSVQTHFVPQYKTFLETSSESDKFESENKYFMATLSFKKLF